MSIQAKKHSKQPQYEDELEKEVPTWASLAILGTVLLSWVVVGVVGPRMPKDSNGVPMFIAAATPFFFLTMVVEMLVIKAIKYRSVAAQFHWVDVWSSISGGSTQQLISKSLMKPLAVALGTGPFAYVWTHYRLVDLEPTASTYMASFFILDLCYYWLHRAGHSVAFMWAAHSVHHNSEHYNLSTALRQSWLQSYFGFMFYLPAALFVPPSVNIACHQWNLLYQYWVHTCVVRRLGPLEWFLMTPSHHRVHHDRRVHKNFAGVFLFDRLFGTLVEETGAWEHPADPAIKADGGWVEEYETFGIMQEIESWEEPVLQYHGWKQLFGRVSAAKGLTGKLGAFIRGPGWSTVLARRKLQRARPSDPNDNSHGTRVMRRIRRHTELETVGLSYITVHFFVCVLTHTLIATAKLDPWTGFAFALWIWPTLMVQGMIWDGHRLALACERLRCLLTVVVVWNFGPSPMWLRQHLAVSRFYVGLHAVSLLLLLLPSSARLFKATQYATIVNGRPFGQKEQ